MPSAERPSSPSADPTASHLVTQDQHGQRLVDVCRSHLGVVSRRTIGPLIAAGDVLVDGQPSRIAQPVTVGQQLALVDGVLQRLTRDRLTTPPSSAPLAVVHQDDALIVVDKPAGLHVHPMGRHRDDTLLGRVLHHVGARPDNPWTDCAPSPAHRLDRPTSGLLVFAASPAARDRLQQLMESSRITRTYTALVHGDPGAGSADQGVIDQPVGADPVDWLRQIPLSVADGGRPARSRWTVLSRSGATTLLELELETGRTHQLRVHLASLGTPIVGDTRYGADPGDGWAAGAIALHASALQLPHPVSGVPLALHAPAPFGTPTAG